MKHIGSELQQLFTLILFAVYLDRRRIVSQAGHFEGTEGWSWIATATEAFLIKLKNAIFLFSLGRIITVIFLNTHQGNVLFVNFILNLQMIHKRAEIIE
jgi:hypothetical protein